MHKLLSVLVPMFMLFSGCTPSEISTVKHVEKSTVLLHMIIKSGDKTEGALCAGVVISPHEILTANHCVSGEVGEKVTKIFVKDFNDRSQEAKIESIDPLDDLALIEVRKPEVPAKVANRTPSVGSTVWVVGMPLGIKWCVTKGIISQVNEKFDLLLGSFFITDATVLPGNSGGGVWNSKGELVGITSMSTSILGRFGASGLGIIIDTETIRNFIWG